ncbi:uncharacterized protein LOC144924466 isoform X5 [Branchiostoma floridae x Branchiostoma belcheri]
MGHRDRCDCEIHACGSSELVSSYRRGVFTNFTAWFSRSVHEETVRAWLQQGGTLADQSCAKFLFSMEAGCPDTKEFFQSSLYLDERLSMFHADFVDASVQQGDMSVVPIGLYVLPPPQLHPEHVTAVTGTSSSTILQAKRSQDHREGILQPTDCSDERTSNEEVTEAQTEAQFKQGNNKKSDSLRCLPVPEPSTEARPDPCDSCRAPHRFLHSRLDDIPHVADLQMSRSELLQDFVPGSNGFSVKCCSK